MPKASGGYIAATREGFADVTAGGAWATRLHILNDGTRMNDAKCDPEGRLWAGSNQMDFAAGHGALHVLDTMAGVRAVWPRRVAAAVVAGD